MKLLAIIALALLIGSAIAAEPRINPAQVNWTKSLPSGEGLILSGTAPTNTTNALYSDSGTLKFNGQGVGGATVYNVESYGATMDGTTDDSAAIQSAITAASAAGGGTVYIPEGTTKILSTLTGADNITIQGAGRGRTVIDMSGVTSSPKTAISATGTLSNNELLSGNVAVGASSLTVSDASGYVAEDWIFISSNDTAPLSTGYRNAGEFKRVRSITEGTPDTITIWGTLWEAYNTAAAASIQNVDFVENFEVRDLDIVGDYSIDSSRGIELYYCNGSVIENVGLYGVQMHGIAVSSSLDCFIQNDMIRGVFFDGINGSSFYGIVVLDCSENIVIDSVVGRQLRHLGIVSGWGNTTAYHGEPRNVVFQNCIAEEMTSYAFGHHGAGKSISFIGNFVKNCEYGFLISGPAYDVICNQNIVRASTATAFELRSTYGYIRRVSCDDNVIEQSYSAYRQLDDDVYTLVDTSFSGNKAYLTGAVHAIQLPANTSLVSIIDNTIYGSASKAYIAVYGNGPDYVQVANNRMYNYQYGAYFEGTCTGLQIQGNNMQGASTKDVVFGNSVTYSSVQNNYLAGGGITLGSGTGNSNDHNIEP